MYILEGLQLLLQMESHISCSPRWEETYRRGSDTHVWHRQMLSCGYNWRNRACAERCYTRSHRSSECWLPMEKNTWMCIYIVYQTRGDCFKNIVQVCDRIMPGYGEQMRAISLRYVPTAVLSRQTAGLRGKSLIINLPGKPKSIRETIDEIFVSIPACISLLEGPYITTNDDVVKAFRPKTVNRSWGLGFGFGIVFSMKTWKQGD